MHNEYTNLAKIKKLLKSRDQIPHHLMLAALNEVTDTLFTDKRRAAANTLSPGVGSYLENWALLDFISAKISDEEVAEIIAIRKTLTSRFSVLLPPMLALFNISDLADIASAIHQIYDCCKDYPTIEKSQYSTQQRKKIVGEINSIISLAKQLDEALDRASIHIDIDFAHHKDAVKRVKTSPEPLREVNEFRSELQMLRFAAQLTLYRDEAGERSFYVGDNRARTHVVEYAYRMTLQFGTPNLKTTPGSDFSSLCSLMFELATGIADESLAGAINKFARSELRREIDREEEVHRYENSDEGIAEYEADNFASIKQRIQNLEAEEAFWLRMLSARESDENSKNQISLRLLDARTEKEKTLKSHGPFIVWASQMSRKTGEEWRSEAESFEAKILELAVGLGQKIRARRS